jgi:exosortase/archaeosortase family protein
MRRAWLRRRLRVAFAVAVIAGSSALSAFVLREAFALRTFEAWLSGHLVPLVTGISAGSSRGAPVIWFENSPGKYLGLLVSADCTVDALIVPFVLATAWSVWRQGRLAWPLFSLAITVGLLLLLNQVRLLVIIVLTSRYGYNSGFYWGHTLLGSQITIFGTVLIFLAYVLIGARRGRCGRAEGNQSSRPAGPTAG